MMIFGGERMRCIRGKVVGRVDIKNVGGEKCLATPQRWLDHERGQDERKASRSPPWQPLHSQGGRGEAHGSVANSIKRLRQERRAGQHQ